MEFFAAAGELLDIAGLAKSLKKIHVETVLLPILIQLGILLLAARFMAKLGRRLGQPEAVGEIAAGLLLGPSFLERVWPLGYNWIFHPQMPEIGADMQPMFEMILHWVFTILSQVGLVLLLFLIGLEFDFSHLKSRGRAAAAISISGIACPFILGMGLAYFMAPYIGDDFYSNRDKFIGFALFMGTAMSITALPILGRMLMELGITNTRLGVITISSAAIDDVAGWIILATVAAIVRGHFTASSVVIMVFSTLGFGVGLLFIIGPLLRWWARGSVVRGELSAMNFAILLTLILCCSIITNLIGIFAIFGAFLLGASLSLESKFREVVGRKLHDFVMVFFLPIFFTYTGLRTRVDTLNSPELWAMCAAVVGVAILGKFGGCGLAAKISGFSTRESLCIGTLMNTRALMELVVINIGKDLGVIPDSVFCMLVIMALLTTVMTAPLLLLFKRGTELEPLIAQSRFATREKFWA